MISTKTLDPKKLRKAALKLRAMNHRIRQRIIEFLNERGEGSVTSITFFLHIDQSVVSQHLAILRRDEIVKTYRDGKFIMYYLNLDEIERMAPIISGLAEMYEMKPSQKREYDNSFRSMRHYI